MKCGLEFQIDNTQAYTEAGILKLQVSLFFIAETFKVL